VIRDLIVDMTRFFTQYHAVEPYLLPADGAPPERERLQSPIERDRIDGLYECILCVYRLFRCRVIMNCADVCPKGLNPARAIEKLRQGVLRQSF